MIKKILAWITGKSDSAVAVAAPYKVETPTVDALGEPPATLVVVVPEAVVPEAVVPSAIETAPVTVKAKYKRADLNKMTKAELMELVAKHGLEIKARAPKADIVKVLSKV